MSINSVVLVGRLTKDVEIRMTQSGTKIGSFTLAVNRNRTGNGGQVEADFIRCMTFNKTAENMERYTHKGSQVAIEGRIQTGSYTDRDGKKVYTTDVACDTVQFLDPRETTNNSYSNNTQMNTVNNYQQQQTTTTTPPPFSRSMERDNPFESDYDPDGVLDIDSDDLPF